MDESPSRALASDHAESSLDLPANSGQAPRHHFADFPEQFRLKVQRFGVVPCEVTVQRIHRIVLHDTRSYDGDIDRIGRRFGRRDPDRPRTAESLERSQRRAKMAVRLKVTELAPHSLVTFTTRKLLSLDELANRWERFVLLVRRVEPGFEYVCVPEPHPKNPDHLHLHVATRGRVSRDTLRRLWHIALEAGEGRRVTATLRGSAAPGNIDDQPIKGRDVIKRIRKIGRYISKYITKDLLERFNRRRYWPSKGINLQAAQVFWLKSLSMAEAIREGMRMLGHWQDLSDCDGAPAFKVFHPGGDRVAWWQVTDDAIPAPPF